VEKLHLMNR